MLRDVKDLKGYAIGATDGELGTVKDLYFDDQQWAIRYLVVETGSWLSGRKVLISPAAAGGVAWDNGRIDVRLTRRQVEDSPGIDTDKPVSRQHEATYYDYYGYPYYWEGASLWGPVVYPVEAGRSAESMSPANRSGGADGTDEGVKRTEGNDNARDSHLRSCNDVVGHDAMASDGPIGRVHGFLFDDATWAIRHVVVQTGNWLPGRRVLLSPQRIRRISWPEREVYLDMSREEVATIPDYVHERASAGQPRD